MIQFMNRIQAPVSDGGSGPNLVFIYLRTWSPPLHGPTPISQARGVEVTGVSQDLPK